ncbi:MAG: hypothetical protein HYT76_09140 [Deltaproteobacteria bacterium]|nr:hypothetical protein [Deltaproteobacteria bacterium]
MVVNRDLSESRSTKACDNERDERECASPALRGRATRVEEDRQGEAN